MLSCGPGQKHMAQEVIGSREEPATLSCQEDILSKGPLSVYVDTPRLVLLPTLGSSECRGACTLTKAQGTFRKSDWERCKNCKAGKKWRARSSLHITSLGQGPQGLTALRLLHKVKPRRRAKLPVGSTK